GRTNLYRQRTEPDDLRDREGARRQDAEFLRLHRLGGDRTAAGADRPYVRLRRAGLDFAERFRAAFGGSIATHSTSSIAAGRATPDPCNDVLAGSAAALRYPARTSRSTGMCAMSEM